MRSFRALFVATGTSTGAILMYNKINDYEKRFGDMSGLAFFAVPFAAATGGIAGLAISSVIRRLICKKLK